MEMATGKLVNSLDNVSNAAASGALALSLPVIQVRPLHLPSHAVSPSPTFLSLCRLPHPMRLKDLQVINTIANSTKGDEEFTFRDIIALPFFSQYQRPALPETEVI